MKRFVHAFVWLLIIAGIGYVGYFSFTKLNTQVSYSSDLGEDPLVAYQEQQESGLIPRDELPLEQVETPEPEPIATEPQGLSEANQDLLERLQGLIDNYGGVMREGSSGSRVGTVQEFLNVYNDRDRMAGVDNSYGPATRASVRAFQQAEGLGSDGLAGPGTFQGMVDWLNENGA